VNDYESTLLEHILGMPIKQIVKHVEALIITRGENGSEIHLPHGEILSIPAVPVGNIADPTGCGDAYRAGLLFGLIHNWPWLKMARLASLLGSIKVQDRHLLAQQYETLFKESLWG
jgi:adenosine kinase